MDAELKKDIRIIKDIRESSANAAKVSAIHQARCESLDRTIARLEALAVDDGSVDWQWLKSFSANWTKIDTHCPINGRSVYVDLDEDNEIRIYENGIVCLGLVIRKMDRQQVVSLCAEMGVEIKEGGE